VANKTVVILGAGAVRAAAGRRAIAKRPPLDCDFIDIARKVNPILCDRVEKQLRQVVGDYATEVLRSLESATTLLYLKAIDSAPKAPAHRTFLDQLNLLWEVIAKTTNPMRVGPRSLLYRLLRREIQQLGNPDDITVITFNYDLAIERTLDEIQKHDERSLFSFPECYRLPAAIGVTPIRGRTDVFASKTGVKGIAVLKLHGSLNWQSTHTSREPTPRALFNTSRKMTVVDCSQVRHNLRLQKGRTVYMKPIILPPVTGKRGLLHDHMATVWDEARRALKSATRIVVLGYSCPPLDFEARMLLGECVQPTVLSELRVVDPNPAVAARFVSLCGVPSVNVFVSAEDYIASAAA